jgi:hypothetical protein
LKSRNTGEEIVRTVIAVVGGFLGIGVLIRITDMLFARLVPAWNPKDPPLYYFAVSLGTDFVYTIVGGYLCALIAEEHRRKATLWLIVLGEVLGIVVQVVLWGVVPHWYGIGLLILYPLGIWIGSSLRRTRTTIIA